MDQATTGTASGDVPPDDGITEPARSGQAIEPWMDDPRFLQVLSTEHWSLLSARSLAYNEAFTRASMFLTFVSMSFVALALVGPPLAFNRTFLVIAAIALTADAVVGVLTLVRVAACNTEDLQAMHGMNRIRHGYVEVIPPAARYFVTGTFDDPHSVAASYGANLQRSMIADIGYGLSTSFGLVGLIVSLVFGALGAVVVLALDVAWPMPLVSGAIAAILFFTLAARWAYRSAMATQASLPVEFPASPR
jgi:hypothetical protein